MKLAALGFALLLGAAQVRADDQRRPCGWDGDRFTLQSQRVSEHSGWIEAERKSGRLQFKANAGKGIIRQSKIKEFSYSVGPEAGLGTLVLKFGYWDEIKFADIPPRCFADFMDFMKHNRGARED